MRTALNSALRHLMTGAIVEKAATLVSGLVLLRLLPLEDYGVLVLAYSAVTPVNFIAGLAMHDLIVSRASGLRAGAGSGSDGLVGSFVFWFAAGLVVVVAAALVARPWLRTWHEAADVYFWWVLGAAITTPLRNLLITLFRVEQDFAAIKRTDIARSCALAAGYVLFIGAFGLGLRGGFMAYVVANLLPAVMALPALARAARRLGPSLRPGPVAALMREEGKWQASRYALTTLHGSARPWLIQAVLGLEAVALFNAAKSVLGIPGDLLPIKEALIPMMGREAANPANIRLLYAESLRYAVLVFGLLAALIAASAPLVFGLIFPQYSDAVPLIQVMSLSYLAAGIATPQASVMYALRLQKFYFSTTALNFALMFALGIPLMLAFGVIGMGVAFVLNAVVASLVRERRLRATCPELRLTPRDILFARRPL